MACHPGEVPVSHPGQPADLAAVPPRVLLVDDAQAIRMIVKQHLPKHYLITECPDAEEGLQKARAMIHDVALVDVEMPGMNGFELCRRLKADSLNADMPVILVTGRTDIEDIEKGFEAGATDYVRKPFNPRELAARVRNAVELKRRGDEIRQWREQINNDLALAGTLQRSLLAPRSLLHEDIRIHATYQSSIEVGGDFFDMISMPGGRMVFYVGDVSGHGVGAAIASTLLKATLAELVREHAVAGPARIANELHRLFIEQFRAPNMYATLFLAVRETTGHAWRCLNCGHPPASVLRAGGQMLRDLEEKGGGPVGFALAGPAPYSRNDEFTLNIHDDMTLLLMTDGMLEAPNTKNPDISPRAVMDALVEQWQHERTGPPMDLIMTGLKDAGFLLGHDDCTAMLVESVPDGQIIFNACINLGLDDLAAVADDMEKALLQSGWPEPSTWAAHLLVVEHGANVLTHGRPPAEARLSVQVRRMHHVIELLLRDNGQPWRYEDHFNDAEPDHDATSGRGLFMIRRTARYLMSCRDGADNVTLFTIARDWKPEP